MSCVLLVAGYIRLPDVSFRFLIWPLVIVVAAEVVLHQIMAYWEIVGLYARAQAEIRVRTRAVAQLREGESKYRTLVEQLPAVTYIATLDEASTTLYISPQVEQLSGYPVAEWLSDPGAVAPGRPS